MTYNHQTVYDFCRKVEPDFLFKIKEKKEGSTIISVCDKICKDFIKAYRITHGAIVDYFNIFPCHMGGFSLEEIIDEMRKRGYICVLNQNGSIICKCEYFPK